MSKKGLTLIELLVVIAIIGLLASIFLVSSSRAKARARDARVITAMNQIRTRAQIIYHENESYDKVGCQKVEDPCTCKDPSKEIKILCTDIVRNAVPDTVVFLASGPAYCVEAQLQGSRKYWCVDSQLHSQEYDDPSCSVPDRKCTP